MQPKEAPVSTTRKAKLHCMDSRLEESDMASLMYDRNRGATQSYVDMTNGAPSEYELTDGSEAVSLLYKDFDEPYSQHRRFVFFNKSFPQMSNFQPFVAPSATIIGSVTMHDCSSIWYDAVLRGDLNKITIGAQTSIQDGVIITTDDRPTQAGRPSAVFVGNQCTVESNAKLHACRIDDACIVGANSIVMEGCRMHTMSILAPNSVLLPGQIVHSYEVWGGNPARKVRTFSLAEVEQFEDLADTNRHWSTIHSTEYVGEDADLSHVREAEQVRDHMAQWMPESPDAPMHWGVWDMLHDFKRRFFPEYYTWSYFYDAQENRNSPGIKGK